MSLLAGLCAESQESGNIAPTAELTITSVTIQTETPANTNITRVFALKTNGSEISWSPPELSSGLANGWLSFWYKREDAAGNTVYEQFELKDGTDLAFKFTTSGNTLQAVDANGTVQGVTSAFAANATLGAGWEHVVIEWVTHATTGEIRVNRDGVLDVEVTGIDTPRGPVRQAARLRRRPSSTSTSPTLARTSMVSGTRRSSSAATQLREPKSKMSSMMAPQVPRAAHRLPRPMVVFVPQFPS